MIKGENSRSVWEPVLNDRFVELTENEIATLEEARFYGINGRVIAEVQLGNEINSYFIIDMRASTATDGKTPDPVKTTIENSRTTAYDFAVVPRAFLGEEKEGAARYFYALKEGKDAGSHVFIGPDIAEGFTYFGKDPDWATTDDALRHRDPEMREAPEVSFLLENGRVYIENIDNSRSTLIRRAGGMCISVEKPAPQSAPEEKDPERKHAKKVSRRVRNTVISLGIESIVEVAPEPEEKAPVAEVSVFYDQDEGRTEESPAMLPDTSHAEPVFSFVKTNDVVEVPITLSEEPIAVEEVAVEAKIIVAEKKERIGWLRRFGRYIGYLEGDEREMILRYGTDLLKDHPETMTGAVVSKDRTSNKYSHRDT